MKHIDECKYYCMDFLNQRNAADAYDHSILEHYYRKNHCSQKNACTIGLHVTDMMIETHSAKLIKMNNHETRDARETPAA
jgi:hypothetical protein